MQEGQSPPPATALGRKSGRLGTAEVRIEAALDRLDAALDGCVRALARQDENSGLVTRLQVNNAALQQTRAEISGRLDAAIERLHRVLAH